MMGAKGHISIWCWHEAVAFLAEGADETVVSRASDGEGRELSTHDVCCGAGGWTHNARAAMEQTYNPIVIQRVVAKLRKRQPSLM